MSWPKIYLWLIKQYLYYQAFYTQNPKDLITRDFTLFHELRHGINKNKFPCIPKENFSIGSYLFFLYWIYDEYIANRDAYDMIDNIFPEKSERWNNFIQFSMEGYIYILKDEKNYQFNKREIQDFGIIKLV